MATAPQTTPYHSNRIREGRHLLFVPGSGSNRVDLGIDQPDSHQRKHREQSEKRRYCPSNCQIDPLTLCLNSQMSVSFFKDHFHPPTADEQTQNLQRRMIKIDRKQRLRIKFTQWIANQYPMDRDWHISAAIPDRRVGVNFDQEHRAQPTETTRLNEVGVRGANRVAVDAFGFDLLPAAAFDRVVNPDDQFAPRSDGRDQHSQQHLRGLKRRPPRAIEHTMIALKALVLTVACHAQIGSDSSFAIFTVPQSNDTSACEARKAAFCMMSI